MRSDEYWMRYALELADKARAIDEVPVGAVIIKDDEVLGEGYNQTISGRDPTAHAEIMALRDASRRINNHRLINTDLYVTIEPCSMCAGALIHARIKRLVYGAAEPRAGAVDSTMHVLANTSLNHKVEVVGGVCEHQAAIKISTFFKARRH